MTDVRRRQFLTVADLEKEDLEHWDWPHYEEDESPKETAISYATHNEKDEDPDELTEEEVSPLTVKELDELHQQAKEEGFHAGKEEGFNVGKEEGLKKGIEEGREQGNAQGYAEGYAAGQSQVSEEILRMTSLIEKLARPIEQVDQNVEKQLVDMTLALVKEVINVELKTNPQIILSTLREAVNSLPVSEQKIDIYLNPDDFNIVEQHYNKEAQQERNWHFIEEPQLVLGDIQVVCNQSQVDYNIQDRISNLFRQFHAANDNLNKTQNMTPDVKENAVPDAGENRTREQNDDSTS